MTARGPQAEVHTAQTFAIRVAATARNSWGNRSGAMAVRSATI